LSTQAKNVGERQATKPKRPSLKEVAAIDPIAKSVRFAPECEHRGFSSVQE
jgi:hypothetical protein